MDIKALEQIEEIKKLKARYFRFVDTQQWEQLAEVFTEDATAHFMTKAGHLWRGRQEIIKGISTGLTTGTSIHHGHMPEIDLISETTATGIWAMSDYVVWPDRTLNGYGHYHEDYVKEKDKWKIKNLRLTRLLEEWQEKGK